MKNINGWHLLDDEKDQPLIESAEKHSNNSNYRDWHSNFIDDIVELYAPNKKKRVALDIGGCVGMMAVPLAQHYKSVFTFEISPIIRECLKLNTQNYSNITVVDFGTSNHNGFEKFQKNEFSGLSSIKSNGTEMLPVRTVDSFKFKRVDLIKIDVEGHEYQTLLGSVNTLKKSKPIVITEIHSDRSRYNYEKRQEIFQLMNKLEYRLVDVRFNDYIWQ